jgi:hypothetical protein
VKLTQNDQPISKRERLDSETASRILRDSHIFCILSEIHRPHDGRCFKFSLHIISNSSIKFHDLQCWTPGWIHCTLHGFRLRHSNFALKCMWHPPYKWKTKPWVNCDGPAPLTMLQQTVPFKILLQHVRSQKQTWNNKKFQRWSGETKQVYVSVLFQLFYIM